MLDSTSSDIPHHTAEYSILRVHRGMIVERSARVTFDPPITCQHDKGHQRAGRRSRPLVLAKAPPPSVDICETWQSELVVTRSFADVVGNAGMTGVCFEEVVIDHAADPVAVSQEYFEMRVTGWGGVANPSSGVELLPSECCATCGLLVYSGASRPNFLFPLDNEPDSDFFIVWPYPKVVFVSPAAHTLLRTSGLRGVQLQSADTWLPTQKQVSPGRLSDWFPVERATRIGSSLGIA